MDRRSFLKTTGAVAGAATLPAVAGASEAARPAAPTVLREHERLTVATRFPLDQPIPYDLIAEITRFRVAENLEKAAAKRKRK